MGSIPSSNHRAPLSTSEEIQGGAESNGELSNGISSKSEREAEDSKHTQHLHDGRVRGRREEE